MRQTRKDRFEMFCAADEYLVPVITVTSHYLPQIVNRDVLSGVGADLLIRSLTFDKLHLNWDESDELILMRSGFANGEHEVTRTRLSDMMESIARVWKARLAERHVAFHFSFPIEDFAGFYDDVTSLGTYIGVDSDIDALFKKVPADDILA